MGGHAVIYDNKLLNVDNLSALKAFESESIDLVYLDPPFNTSRTWEGLKGTRAEHVKFDDSWSDVDYDLPPPESCAWFIDNLQGKDKSYLTFMSLRLHELHRVLKPTGSIYLHSDLKMSHYLKICMDMIFGQRNYRNEITWKRCFGQQNDATSQWARRRDSLLFYGKTDAMKFNVQRRDRDPDSDRRRFPKVDDKGRRYAYQSIGRGRGAPKRKAYMGDMHGVAYSDLWDDNDLISPTHSPERTGWPTEKPLALLKRIIQASSDEGDRVLDPFAGSGSTLIAAEALKRLWYGIEINKDARDIFDAKRAECLGMFAQPYNYVDVAEMAAATKGRHCG